MKKLLIIIFTVFTSCETTVHDINKNIKLNIENEVVILHKRQMRMYTNANLRFVMNFDNDFFIIDSRNKLNKITKFELLLAIGVIYGEKRFKQKIFGKYDTIFNESKLAVYSYNNLPKKCYNRYIITHSFGFKNDDLLVILPIRSNDSPMSSHIAIWRKVNEKWRVVLLD